MYQRVALEWQGQSLQPPAARRSSLPLPPVGDSSTSPDDTASLHPLTHFRLLQEVLFFNTFIFVFFLNHEVKSTYLFLFLTVPYYDSSRQHQISPHCPSPINISINFSLLNLIFIKSVPFLIVLQVKGSFTPTIVSDIRPNRLHPEKKGVNFDEKRGKTKIFVWGKFI